ncbi:hypothetical protein CVU76_00365 [Candidatus Dojkabacteria bacterium HGW-Dojkabacteria-1]|uniref:Uncharacterized protein n=1 Tax=Candidatus Dojkabacteria bacterium HGW-Dojkabacteria-1 TaxID=2013761 RepID=A0A2N2F2R7_9BACT|nr:MAG: hypothetical protein CVU76_00365 [Candidatus Dojkabacteria bacterium HGW-Dojkabacteria-1]
MKKKEKEKKEKQLDFGLKNPPQNIYYKYKDQYELWLSGLETHRFMKDLLMWFVLVMSISLISTQIYSILNLEILPSRIPVLGYFFSLSLRLVDSFWIYFLPSLSILILISGFLFANKYYHRERELSKLLLVAVLLSTMSLSVIFFKLVYSF